MSSHILPSCFESEREDCRLISVGRPSPSPISSATSSSSSVASTTKLLPTKQKKKPLYYLIQKEIMTQKEKNLLFSVPQLEVSAEKKPEDVEVTEVEAPTQKKVDCKALIRQGAAAIAVSLCSMVVGFSSAYTSPAIVSMNLPESRLHVTEQEASWIGSLMPLSALFGGIVGGPLIELMGRKTTILSTAGPFLLSFLLISFATDIAMVMVGRCITGFCVGVSSLALPVYLGETLQPEVRGTYGLCPTTFGNFGILLCFFLGSYLDWTALALFGAMMPILYFILMFLVPESPTWFISKNKVKNAQKALQWLRGENADVEKEMAELQKFGMANEESITLKELCTKKYMWPLSISLGLMFFQQLSGINAVIFYTVKIFEDAGSTIDSNLSSIIVGLVNLGATLAATFLIDRLGRKMLLYISNILMALTLAVLGGFFYCKSDGMDVSSVGWIPLASFVLFVIGFSFGAGPIPWLMMGEILPAKVRGTAASIATAFNWLCTFIVTKTFVDLNKQIGAHGTFWLFGFICVISLFFVIFFVPETRGKSLEDIERKFMGEDVKVREVRRMSSRINLKPMPSAL